MTVRAFTPKPTDAATASVLALLGLCSCAPLVRAPYYAPTAYQAAPVYQPAPAYQPRPVYQPAPPPYYYGQQPSQPAAPMELFDPPPGPITDFCASELQERMAVRNALIAKGTMQPYIADADRKVRRTWEVCQKQYLTALEKRANLNSPAATLPPQAEQPIGEAAAQPDAGSSQPIDPAPPLAEAAGAPAVQSPPPSPAGDQATAAPHPVKLTAAQRKAAAEREEKRKAEAAEREEKRKAERAAKKAEKEERARQAKAAAEELVRAYCGPEPERSAWDGIYIGVERYFKKIANDPDSVEFTGCTPAVLKGPPRCWVTECGVRAKNAFGAKILRALTFGKNSDGWADLSD
jgi:hypothetical protein